jgi:hypothetical protein
MARDFTFQKRTIIAGIVLLLAADVALGVYRWQLSKTPTSTDKILKDQTVALKKMRAQIEDAEKVADNLPNTIKDCDKFESELPSSNTVSSTVATEISEAAKKSGIQLSGVSYHDSDSKRASTKEHSFESNITERTVDANISGSYENVVKFLNNLQKSQAHFVIESLDLSTEASAPNSLRVSLHLRTFFRAVAA